MQKENINDPRKLANLYMLPSTHPKFPIAKFHQTQSSSNHEEKMKMPFNIANFKKMNAIPVAPKQYNEKTRQKEEILIEMKETVAYEQDRCMQTQPETQTRNKNQTEKKR